MKRTSLLVVDDSAVVREGLTALFAREADIQVTAEAVNGQEAMDLFRRHRPDVTLMDLRMPVLNGVQATSAICREFPDACIVALTASEASEDIEDALRAGAKQYLLKGGERAELLQTIRFVYGELCRPGNPPSR